MKLHRIVVASSNEGKIAEIKSIFTDVEIVSMHELGFTDEIEETGKSFKENAKLKAETIAKKFSLPALSDDSGCASRRCTARRGFIPHAFRAKDLRKTASFY